MRRFPVIVAAILVLALSGTAAFAAGNSSNARPAHPARPTASPASPAVTASPAREQVDEDASPDVAETEAPEAAAPAPAAPTAANHPENHGLEVSIAAHATTPPEFANHGAYVSSIARKDHGQAPKAHGKAPTQPATPTPTPS